jgi:hypothetical protein
MSANGLLLLIGSGMMNNNIKYVQKALNALSIQLPSLIRSTLRSQKFAASMAASGQKWSAS